jgi:TonB family protein
VCRGQAARWSFVTALLLALSVRPAVAADDQSDWNGRLQEAMGLLEAGKTAKAVKQLDSLLEDYLQIAGRGEGNERNLGTILVDRAIGEVRLGRVEDAHWDWDVAANFLPDTSHLDLSRFGDAGRLLHEYALERAVERERRTKAAGAAPGCEACVITAPKVIKRPKPKYTLGARFFHVTGQLVVQVVVDKTGRVSKPEVLQKVDAPSLAYQALDAVRHWKFEPAKLDGRPVPTYYNLTVNFELGK